MSCDSQYRKLTIRFRCLLFEAFLKYLEGHGDGYQKAGFDASYLRLFLNNQRNYLSSLRVGGFDASYLRLFLNAPLTRVYPYFENISFDASYLRLFLNQFDLMQTANRAMACFDASYLRLFLNTLLDTSMGSKIEQFRCLLFEAFLKFNSQII